MTLPTLPARTRRYPLSHACRYPTLALVLGIVLSCGDGPTAPKSGPAPDYVTLHVLVGPGVKSSPAAGDHRYERGDQVPYSLAPEDGYYDVYGALDSIQVATSGTIPMTGDRTLAAAASKVIPIPAAAAPLIEAAHAAAEAADPTAAYQAMLDQLQTVRAQQGDAVADSAWDAVALQAFDPIKDSASVRRLTMGLAGHIFDASASASASGASSPSRSVAVEPAGSAVAPVTYIYVNGINVNPFEAGQGFEDLQGIVQEALPTVPHRMRWYYNATFAYSTNASASCMLATGKAALEYDNLAVWASLLLKCNGVAQDLEESARQFLDVTGIFKSDAVQDAVNLENTIADEIASGRRVVLVAHSQGNLMVQQALAKLYQDGRGNGKCIGVVSLATPSSAYPVGNESVTGFHVKGKYVQDIILRLGPQKFPTIRTMYSDLADNIVDQSRGLLDFNIAVTMGDLALHASHESYMSKNSAPEAHARIVDAIKQYGSTLESCGGAPLLPMAVGNRWVYQRSDAAFDGMVTNAPDETYDVQDTARIGDGLWYKTNYQLIGAGFIFSGVRRETFPGVYDIARDNSQQLIYQRHVGSGVYFELLDSTTSVTVPAGTFQTFRYRRVIDYPIPPTSTFTLNRETRTHYLAPGVGIVKTEYLIEQVVSGQRRTMSGSLELKCARLATPLPDGTPACPGDPLSITLSSSEMSFTAGETGQVQATVHDGEGHELPDLQLTWKSSDPTVATVAAGGNQSATITAVAEGTAVITAETGDGSASASLTVRVQSRVVASVVVAPATATLTIGKTLKLGATALDASSVPIPEAPITWSSSDASLVSIATDGTVTAVAPGTATITASSGDAHGTATITATDVKVASVTVEPATGSVKVGASLVLKATAKDSAGNVLSDRTVTWSSSDESLATVSLVGVVTGVAPGNVTITATVDGAAGHAAVTVQPKSVAGVTVSPTSLSLTVGGTGQLTATVHDSSGNVLDQPVTWSSGSPAIATVSATGLVTAIAAGVAQITASAGGMSGAAVVTVTAPPAPVASIEITPADTTIGTGQDVTLKAVLRDAAKNVLTGRSISWRSTADSVATVSTAGVVHGVAPGQAEIIATSEGVSDTARVTVVTTAPPASIVVQPSSGSTPVNGTLQLTATVRDASGNVLSTAPVTWRTADATIATVTSSGLVTGVSVGTVDITAVSGTVAATAHITITRPRVARVVLSPDSLLLSLGQTGSLSAMAYDSSGHTLTDRVVSWTSSAPSVATVTGSGYAATVTAIAAGAATIRATVDSVTGTAKAIVAAQMARRWVGGAAPDGASWSNPANWSPSGVPGSADSAYVPATVPTLPQLSGSATVGALVLETGATLAVTGTLTVERSVIAGSGITGGIVELAGRGMSAAGIFPSVAVTGGVTLSGDVTAKGSLAVSGSGALTVNGRNLHVQQDLGTSGTGIIVMRDANDRVVVDGSVDFEGGSGTGNFTAGVLTVAGNFTTHASGAFVGSGTHTVVLDGPAGTVQVLGMENIRTDQNVTPFQNLQISGDARVNTENVEVGLCPPDDPCYGRVLVNGNLNVTKPVLFGKIYPDGTRGGGMLIVRGVYSAVSGHEMAGQLVLENATALDQFQGTFSGNYIAYAAPGQVMNVRPELSTVTSLNILNGAKARLTGPTTIGDPTRSYLAVRGAGSALDLNGFRLDVAIADVDSAAFLTMQHDGDSLVARSDVTLRMADRRGQFSAGVLMVGGSFYADYSNAATEPSYVQSGTHKLVLDGTGTNPQALVVANFGAGPGASLPIERLEVTGSAGAQGDVDIRSRFVLGAGSRWASGTIQLENADGTMLVDGDLSENTQVRFDLAGGAQQMKAGPLYNAVQVTNGARVQVAGSGAVSIGDGTPTRPGYLFVQDAGSSFDLNGHRVNVGTLLAYPGTQILMQHDPDSLVVRGDATLEKADRRGDFTAGVLMVGGGFEADYTDPTGSPSYVQSGTHKLVLDGSGTAPQSLSVANFAAGPAASLPLQRLEVTGSAIVQGDVDVTSSFRMASGSQWISGSVQLESPDGTMQVDGSFSQNAGVRFALAGGTQQMRAGLTYSRVEIANGARVQVNGSGLTMIGDGTPSNPGYLTVSGAASAFDLAAHRVDVGSVTVDAGAFLTMQHDADSLVARGDVTLMKADRRGQFTAGALMVGGAFYADFSDPAGAPSYVQSGTHTLVLDGNGTTQQAISMYNTNAAQGLPLQRLEVTGNAVVSGDVDVTSLFAMASGTHWVSGSVRLENVDGTMQVDGDMTGAATVIFAAPGVAQQMKAGARLATVIVSNGARVQLSGSGATLIGDGTPSSNGYLDVRDTGSEFDLGGHLVDVGMLNVEAGAMLTMTHDADSLIVHHDATLGAADRSGHFSAGALIVAGNFYADFTNPTTTPSYVQSGTHRLVLNGSGSTPQTLSLYDVGTGQGLPLARLEATGSAGVTGDARITTSLSMASGESWTSGRIVLENADGTAQVSGQFGANTTVRFAAPGGVQQPIRAGISYGSVEVFGSAAFQSGATSIAGSLTNGGTLLNPTGSSVDVAQSLVLEAESVLDNQGTMTYGTLNEDPQAVVKGNAPTAR